jgi:hypothetical protein
MGAEHTDTLPPVLHCPACDYELGTLPGVPPDAGAAFAEDVRCPECGHGMPRGTRLLHGTQWVAALQPATPWARLSAMLAPVAFAIYIGLKNGIEGVVGLLGVGKSKGLWIDLLGGLMLPVMAYVAWRSIRLWRSGSEAGGEARRQLAGREITWQVTPGSFEIFRRASHDGTPATELHQAADLRRVTVHPAPSVRIRKGAVPRNVVLVEAFFWTRGTDGRRSDLRSISMYADAGGELAGAGTGHRAAAIAAGQRLAEGIEATLRGEAAPAGDAGAPAGAGPPPEPATAGAIVTAGTPDAVRPFEKHRGRARVAGALASIGIAVVGVPASILLIGPAVLVWIPVVIVLAVGAGAGAWWSVRAAGLRRAAATATWTVTPGELRVDRTDSRDPAGSLRTRAMHVPKVHEITVGDREGRPVLLARTRSRRVIAALDANLGPDATAQLARRMNAIIWEGRSAQP